MNAEVPKPAPTIEDAIPITTTLQNAASSVGESISNLIPGTTTTEEKKDEEAPADLGVDTSMDSDSMGVGPSVESMDSDSMGVGPSVESALAPVEDTFPTVVSTSSSTGTRTKKKGKKCKCPTKKQKGSKKKYPRCKRGRRNPKTKKCKGAKKCSKGSKKDPYTGACKPK